MSQLDNYTYTNNTHKYTVCTCNNNLFVAATNATNELCIMVIIVKIKTDKQLTSSVKWE